MTDTYYSIVLFVLGFLILAIFQDKEEREKCSEIQLESPTVKK